MTPETDTAASKPPPGAPAAPAPVPPQATQSAVPHPEQPAPKKGGLPDPWGRRLPVIMLAALVVGVGLLIITSSDKPTNSSSSSSFSTPPDETQVTPSQPAPQDGPPPAAQPSTGASASSGTTGATGATGTSGETSSEDAASTSPEVSDAETKSIIAQADEAMETCAVNSGGAYTDCTVESLGQVAPEVRRSAAKLRLTVRTTSNSYVVEATSPATGTVFKTSRGSDGRAINGCTAPGKNGCPASGTW